MSNKDDKALVELNRLADALVEDIFNMSDEEVMSENADADAASDDAQLKELFETALVKANKKRLAAAKAGAAAAREPTMRIVSPVVDIATARERIRYLVGSTELPQPLTLAARNEEELSDADILSLYEDLVELGILPPARND